jgi:hypothetical protein
MKFPWKNTPSEGQSSDDSVAREEAQPSSASERQSPVRMALIVATSALLGGITVALWNRGILEGMRRPVPPVPPQECENGPDNEEFI